MFSASHTGIYKQDHHDTQNKFHPFQITLPETMQTYIFQW